MLLFVLLYTVFTILMIPGATVLTLAGGAIFGFWWGSILVSIGSTLGATVSFLGARFLFREAVQNRFHNKLDTINKNFNKDGLFYLFTLRVIPILPYFVINVMMGLTKIRLLAYVFISWLGMFIVTMVYVNAGTQLAQLRSIQGILSPTLLISFALIGIFPLLAKFAINYWKSKR